MDAYQHMAPMVDTVVFMQWLYTQCKAKGCRFVYDYIQGLLSDQAEDLKNKYKAQVIINCSGLNAKELAGDNDVYPSRGEKGKVSVALYKYSVCVFRERREGGVHTAMKTRP